MSTSRQVSLGAVLLLSRLVHADDTEETLQLRHSYSERQLEWFRAGSALNTISRVPARSAHPA